MSDKNFDEIENVDIEPLSDEALEDVAGGLDSCGSCCSCNDCSNGSAEFEAQ